MNVPREERQQECNDPPMPPRSWMGQALTPPNREGAEDEEIHGDRRVQGHHGDHRQRREPVHRARLEVDSDLQRELERQVAEELRKQNDELRQQIEFLKNKDASRQRPADHDQTSLPAQRRRQQ